MSLVALMWYTFTGTVASRALEELLDRGDEADSSLVNVIFWCTQGLGVVTLILLVILEYRCYQADPQGFLQAARLVGKIIYILAASQDDGS